MKKQSPYDFVKTYYNIAKYIDKNYGWPWSITIAQCALESGWGEKSINNNPFGIKAYSTWKGKTQKVLTTDYINGEYVKRYQLFRDYDSLRDAFIDYSNVILRHYKNGFPNVKNRYDLAMDLGNWYAQEPNYGNIVVSVMKTVEEQEKLMIKNNDLPRYSITIDGKERLIIVFGLFVIFGFVFYMIIKRF